MVNISYLCSRFLEQSTIFVCSENNNHMKAEEPITSYNHNRMSLDAPRHQSVASMPCSFSEDELDEEIRLSMKSGNATQDDINAVFSRWMH